MSDDHVAEVTFAAEPVSVPDARRLVIATVLSWDAGWSADAAAQVVTELATNALFHAHTPFTVRVARAGADVVVGVSDRSPRLPRTLTSAASMATTGRGMRLVATLSDDWGLDANGSGKTVWARFTAPPGRGRDAAGTSRQAG